MRPDTARWPVLVVYLAWPFAHARAREQSCPGVQVTPGPLCVAMECTERLHSLETPYQIYQTHIPNYSDQEGML